MTDYVRWLQDLGMEDVPVVGGKNASLGEMIRNLDHVGVRVPGGFATTAEAYREFLAQGGLDERIQAVLDELDVEDVAALTEAGPRIRGWILEQPFPAALESAIDVAYERLSADAGTEVSWAVRSSATAEDLPDASFAGQQETFLNVHGLDHIKHRIREVFASLFNDRAIAYRVHQGFEHRHVALSAGVQRMVRSDRAASGVMFTLDTESGFRDAVFITASYGLGEMVVQGAVNPDEFYVHKPTLAAGRPAILRRTLGHKAIRMIYAPEGAANPVVTEEVPEAQRLRFSLTDAEILDLARQAVLIEQHYDRPMDIEWAKDGLDGRLYIVQARPETVQSRSGQVIERYLLKGRGEVLTSGRSIGHRIGAGAAKVIESAADMHRVEPGDVLVTDMTDPDWEPVMKRAAAIVTNRGGRTCHAAIIARELGVPAVVGCNDATDRIHDGRPVTVSCAEGDTGFIYDGILPFDHKVVELTAMPEIPVKIMMNVGNPERAFAFAATPNKGIGLARLEFIISNSIGIHPKALLEYDRLPADLQAEIAPRIAAYASPREFYVAKLAEGISHPGGGLRPESGDRPHVGLQVQRVRQPDRRPPLRAPGGEPHDRLPRCRTLCLRELPRLLRAGVRGDQTGAQRHGTDQPGGHDPLRAHPGTGQGGGGRLGRTGAQARGERAAAHHDVRDPLQRRARRGVPGALRRLLHRIQRHDPAHPGAGPGLEPGGRRLRRAGPSGEEDALHGHRRLPGPGQVRGDLRSGALGPPGPGGLAAAGRDRQHVTEPGHGHRHLGLSRGAGQDPVSGRAR